MRQRRMSHASAVPVIYMINGWSGFTCANRKFLKFKCS
jgi:hypothetical protein